MCGQKSTVIEGPNSEETLIRLIADGKDSSYLVRCPVGYSPEINWTLYGPRGVVDTTMSTTTTISASSIAHAAGIQVHPVQSEYVCESTRVDLFQPLSTSDFNRIRDALHRYGVVVIPRANLPDDQAHVEFSRPFGEVERSKWRGPHMRPLPYDEIFDISNLDENGEVVTGSNEKRITAIRGNALWHADGSFNPRRTYVSMLRAVELPLTGTGGATEYADARKAYDDLPQETKDRIKNMVAVYSFLHNRQTANPDSPLFKGGNVLDEPLARHRLVPIHEPSGRPMRYVTSYAHHIEGMPVEEGQHLLRELMAHVTQPKYVVRHEWQSNGDVVVWDNTAVLHRATPGAYEGKYRRDMRRTCVMDSSKDAYGLNNPEDAKGQRSSS